ncbi:MAG: hypothetical protein II117_07490 [Clostridia bacterium]|nr:hypothetical protein [Clostridia bacterium]
MSICKVNYPEGAKCFILTFPLPYTTQPSFQTFLSFPFLHHFYFPDGKASRQNLPVFLAFFMIGGVLESGWQSRDGIPFLSVFFASPPFFENTFLGKHYVKVHSP